MLFKWIVNKKLFFTFFPNKITINISQRKGQVFEEVHSIKRIALSSIFSLLSIVWFPGPRLDVQSYLPEHFDLSCTDT